MSTGFEKKLEMKQRSEGMSSPHEDIEYDDFFKTGALDSPLTESLRGFKGTTDRRLCTTVTSAMNIPKQYRDKESK